MLGWDGGIRTPECRHQKPMPYHLATSQYVYVVRTKFVATMVFGAAPYSLLFALRQTALPYHVATSHSNTNCTLIGVTAQVSVILRLRV
jgi:hypothetical protein